MIALGQFTTIYPMSPHNLTINIHRVVFDTNLPSFTSYMIWFHLISPQNCNIILKLSILNRKLYIRRSQYPSRECKLDTHQKNLSDFEDFLTRHRFVPPEKVRFYVYWVVRFLKYYQNRPSKPSAQIVSSYIEAMETDSRFADWQVKQAADAILLYTDIPIRRESEFRVSPGVGVIV